MKRNTKSDMKEKNNKPLGAIYVLSGDTPTQASNKKSSSASAASKKVSKVKILEAADKPPTKKDLVDDIENKVEQLEGMMEGEDEDMVISDNFKVTSKSTRLNNCLQLVNFVQLPRLIFAPSRKKQSSNQGDKSPLLLKLLGGLNKEEKINPYTDLLKASRDGLEDITIEVFDHEETPLMKFTLIEPRIHAIDFGDFALERKEFREIKVEFDYEYIAINDEEL